MIGPGAYALDTYLGLMLPVVPILAIGLVLAVIGVAISLLGVERRAKAAP